jgi:hypothetical protein
VSDSDKIEREGSAILVRIWGMDERDARELLRAAGMDVELACDAWLDAAEHLAKARVAGSAIPRTDRLALAMEYARQRR